MEPEDFIVAPFADSSSVDVVEEMEDREGVSGSYLNENNQRDVYAEKGTEAATLLEGFIHHNGSEFADELQEHVIPSQSFVEYAHEVCGITDSSVMDSIERSEEQRFNREHDAVFVSRNGLLHSSMAQRLRECEGIGLGTTWVQKSEGSFDGELYVGLIDLR